VRGSFKIFNTIAFSYVCPGAMEKKAVFFAKYDIMVRKMENVGTNGR